MLCGYKTMSMTNEILEICGILVLSHISLQHFFKMYILMFEIMTTKL